MMVNRSSTSAGPSGLLQVNDSKCMVYALQEGSGGMGEEVQQRGLMGIHLLLSGFKLLLHKCKLANSAFLMEQLQNIQVMNESGKYCGVFL